MVVTITWNYLTYQDLNPDLSDTELQSAVTLYCPVPNPNNSPGWTAKVSSVELRSQMLWDLSMMTVALPPLPNEVPSLTSGVNRTTRNQIA